MRAAAYQRSEPDRCCICGPGVSSMTSSGCAVASVAKKKSGPRPAQAVPSFSSLASKLAVIASRRPPLLDLARSINCGADSFSAELAEETRHSDRRISFHIEQILYRHRKTEKPFARNT